MLTMGFITDAHSTDDNTTTTTITYERGHKEAGQFSILHIILFAFGGVIFVIGIITIIALLKSRKKFRGNGAASRDRTRSRQQSPVFVVGQGIRRGPGGDNPAFSRADEASSGALPFSRNTTTSQSRLPTYEEVMSGRVPTAPTSRSPPRSNIQTSPHRHRLRQPQQSSPRGTTRRDPEAAVPRSLNVTPPPRYAYEYPSCYWEEVPPPPYSAGNCGMVRGLGGMRGSAQGRERRENTVENGSPFPGRAPLAVPTPTGLSPAQSPALPPRNHILTSSCSAAPATVTPPSPMPAFSSNDSCRPLAASSPAVPRRQLAPAGVPILAQLEFLSSVGGRQNCASSAALQRSRSDVARSQGPCYGDVRPSHSRTVHPSAPMARFDVEL